MVTGSCHCVRARLGKFRPSRLASAGVLGPAIWNVSTTHHVHMSAVITVRSTPYFVLLWQHMYARALVQCCLAPRMTH